METLKKMFTWIKIALILLLGLLFVVWGGIGLRSSSSEWTSVEAQVISASPTGEADSTDYKITYEFQVGAKKYTGSYTYFEERPVGEKMTVYYDPSDPGISARSREEAKWQSFWSLIFGLGCVGWVIWEVIRKYGQSILYALRLR
jgi:hypothetical protein